MHVSDGDSLRIDGERIRLWGIDAPELGQRCRHDGQSYDCGKASQAALSSLIGSSQVKCEMVDTDRYGRTVARCFVGGTDLGAAMVRLGWAVDFARYSKGYYAGEQEQAKAAGRGLWGGDFEPPWEWRR